MFIVAENTGSVNIWSYMIWKLKASVNPPLHRMHSLYFLLK